jgi:hypothetical protein
VQRQELTQQGKRRLRAAEARIAKAELDLDEARRAWAKLVRDELGQAAVAREMGLTPQALWDRLRAVDRGSRR